VDVKLLTQLAD